MQGPNACLGKILGEKCDVEARTGERAEMEGEVDPGGFNYHF